ncbi:MAG: TetR/AcrR family transcriptional regulator [Mycobacteriaceae bacterium]|nr:TetR/AcrR family transcriptional regulator [Mycobacteriaceae bacterium]
MTSAERQYGGRALAERVAERHRRFVAAAIRMFAERGYANCTLAELCTAAGLSKRQFYEVFDTREEVLVAAYDHIQDAAAAAVVTAAAGLGPELDLEESVTVLLTAYLDSVGSDPCRAKVAFVEVVGVSDAMERHRRDRRHAWATVFGSVLTAVAGPEAKTRGSLVLATSALNGAVNGIAHEWILADPRPPVAELVDVLGPVITALIVRN